MPPTSPGRPDPHSQLNFRVEIAGIVAGAFSEVTGLDVSVDVVDYREGGDPSHVRKLPGLTKYATLTLTRGFTGSTELWEWMKKTIDGQIERKAGSIILLNDARQEVARWNFYNGWPCRWTGPSLNATGNEVAIETLEIVHEGLELAR